jgi:hypothetical protein
MTALLIVMPLPIKLSMMVCEVPPGAIVICAFIHMGKKHRHSRKRREEVLIFRSFG